MGTGFRNISPFRIENESEELCLFLCKMHNRYNYEQVSLLQKKHSFWTNRWYGLHPASCFLVQALCCACSWWCEVPTSSPSNYDATARVHLGKCKNLVWWSISIDKYSKVVCAFVPTASFVFHTAPNSIKANSRSHATTLYRTGWSILLWVNCWRCFFLVVMFVSFTSTVGFLS